MNFKIKITICLRKNLTKVKLQRKKLTKTTKKQTNKRKNKQKKRKKDTLPTQPVFPKDFSHAVYLFLS